MDWLNFILGLLTLLFAGVNIFQFIFFRQTKKKYKADADKASASAKSDEIENMRKAMENFYLPLLKNQDERIAKQDEKIAQRDARIDELETEMKTLRDEKREMELAYQRQIAELQKQVTDITRALGIKANKQLRNGRGQFTSEKEK